MTVEEYYYWLYIVSQGLYNAIVSELREKHTYALEDILFLHEHFGDMLFEQMDIDIGF